MRSRQSPSPPLPHHWIGVWKGWQHFSASLSDALVVLTPAQLATHALVIGSSGSGKTNLLTHIIAMALRWGLSLVIIDPRGDFCLSCLELCARFGIGPAKIRFFDLRDKKNPWGFNPLVGSGEVHQRVLSVLGAIEAQAEASGVQWPETLRNALMLLAEAGLSLVHLEAVFYSPNLRRQLIERCKSESVRGFWERYGALSLDKQATLAQPVMNKISLLLAAESIRRTFGQSEPVNLKSQLDMPGSVTLFSMAVDELHGAGRAAGSMFLSAVKQEVFARINTPESDRNPVLLVADEFHGQDMESFESILAETRKFKLAAVMAHQTISQLSPKLKSLVLGNVGVKAVFRVAHQDADVLNKDLGVAKGTFDLGRLPVGEAVLWRKGDQPWPVEINAPLIRDVGRLSPKARRLLELLEEFKPTFHMEQFENAEDNTACSPKQERRQSRNPQSDLEDWL
ncbi:MAG: DUF87 domain-containing protein [Armatimonadetes bacterium]|nr:MAG: DUF87 domain-containing protein [Armatimonadota bacterium]